MVAASLDYYQDEDDNGIIRQERQVQVKVEAEQVVVQDSLNYYQEEYSNVKKDDDAWSSSSGPMSAASSSNHQQYGDENEYANDRLYLIY